MSDDMSPEEVLAAAATTLSETSGVGLTLSTTDLPAGVSGITKADGVATNQPAFEGTISVIYAGQSVEVPVVAINDVVHAVLPFTSGDYQEIDPGEYGAPDPAQLITAESGFPSLLGVTSELEEGESVRGGSDNTEVLTTYTGTVPGAAMKKVIPSAAGKTFAAEYLVSDDGELRQAVMTGVFYPKSAEMTYTVDLADYGLTKEIAAP
ncbi:LppX_LprAFG lipoprotein [Nocardioides piscis]|uniref:LppX_LprAFG lipoprotein n=1 Tax=Nocardioides piscis TaxID=2714938 RepID=A0A6G7YI60_9ACTN|nr:LppX_LprAFG lipoprotein [Nocardioides piscis]QIK76321.1 LppX_LprAFG lipoprotein [Nocardioides piscis]